MIFVDINILFGKYCDVDIYNSDNAYKYINKIINSNNLDDWLFIILYNNYLNISVLVFIKYGFT
jgi:hypothetical protein